VINTNLLYKEFLLVIRNICIFREIVKNKISI